MKITLLYQVSHYIRVQKQRNIKSWDQQNYLVIRGFCYIRPLYNEVPLYCIKQNYNDWWMLMFWWTLFSSLYTGSTYNIPICIWVLETHPYNPPLCFVRPTSTMLIKPSKHVDANGRIYLPYLHDWKPVSGLTLCSRQENIYAWYFIHDMWLKEPKLTVFCQNRFKFGFGKLF